MRNASWLVLSSSVVLRSAVVTMGVLASFMAPGCTVGDGDFDWDGSLFDDAGLERDGAADEDAGASAPDSSVDDASVGDAGSDSGAADAGEPDRELRPGDVARVIARGRCGALRSCLGEQLLLASFEGNDCVSFTTRQLQDRHLHWLEDSVEAGRVTFRPERLAACELDLIQLGCDVTTTPWPANCEQAVEGKAAEDAECTIDQDCQGSAYCDKGELESCPGYCVPLQSEGMPCGSSSECGIGLWCREGACGLPPREGDACDVPLEVAECPPGLVCQGASGESTCQSIDRVYSRRAGEDCDAFGHLCEFGLVCQSQSATSSSGRCVAPAVSGGECRRAQPSQCPADEYCRSAQSGTLDPAEPGSIGVCSARPTAGEACPHENCVPGARCLGDPQVCKPLKSAGGSCKSDGECYGGLCSEPICSVTTIGCD